MKPSRCPSSNASAKLWLPPVSSNGLNRTKPTLAKWRRAAVSSAAARTLRATFPHAYEVPFPWDPDDEDATTMGNSSGCVGGAANSGVTSGVGSTSRSRASCPAGSNNSLARAISTPNSAGECADPTCLTIRWRPSTYSAICTAIAPDAVRTRRMNTTPSSLDTRP